MDRYNYNRLCLCGERHEIVLEPEEQEEIRAGY